MGRVGFGAGRHCGSWPPACAGRLQRQDLVQRRGLADGRRSPVSMRLSDAGFWPGSGYARPISVDSCGGHSVSGVRSLSSGIFHFGRGYDSRRRIALAGGQERRQQ